MSYIITGFNLLGSSHLIIAIFRGKIYLDMFIALANHCMEDKLLVWYYLNSKCKLQILQIACLPTK